jgi:hypothetical protein
MSATSTASAGAGLSVLGIIAPLVYGLTVAYFGTREDYSHYSRAISELSEKGAPDKLYVDLSFGLYNIFAILGAVGFYLSTSWIGSDFQSAGGVFIATCCISIFMTFFPQDPISKEQDSIAMSFSGRIHIITAGITALLTMVTMGLVTTASLSRSVYYPFGVYCALALTFQIITGLVAAIAAGRLHPLMGLAERFTIGNYLLWMLVTCSLCAGYYFFP